MSEKLLPCNRCGATIDRRTWPAEKPIVACWDVDDYIRANGLEGEVEDFDWMGGVEIYIRPRASGERIKQAIRDHNKKRDMPKGRGCDVSTR